MDDEDNDEPGRSLAPVGATWPDVFRDMARKIPEAYQKSLLKAFIRLVHSATGVGTTWLDTKARDLQSQQKAREAVRDALAKAAFKEIRDRPDVVDRAVDHYVNDIIGKQENREAVIKKSLEYLVESTTPPSSASEALKEIDEDWLDGLSRHAENASSDRMRSLFGKILAGEIRQPGKYSLFTLDQLTKLRREDTQLIVEIAPLVLLGMIVRTPRTDPILTYGLALRLAEIGFLNPISIGAMPTQRSWNTTTQVLLLNRPAAYEVDDALVCFFSTKEPQEVKLVGALLTAVGRELLTLIDYVLDTEMLKVVADKLAEQGAEFFLANLVELKDDQIHWRNLHKVEGTLSVSSPTE